MTKTYGTGFETSDGRVLRVRRVGVSFYIGTLPDTGNFKILYGPFTTSLFAEKRAEEIAGGASPENYEVV